MAKEILVALEDISIKLQSILDVMLPPKRYFEDNIDPINNYIPMSGYLQKHILSVLQQAKRPLHVDEIRMRVGCILGEEPGRTSINSSIAYMIRKDAPVKRAARAFYQYQEN